MRVPNGPWFSSFLLRGEARSTDNPKSQSFCIRDRFTRLGPLMRMLLSLRSPWANPT
jgi:hypothetical protein